MICQKCDGRGKTTEYDGLRKFWCDYKCEVCNGTGEVMTEREWLRICSTEEFAEWIASEINERVKLALHDSELNDGDVDADFYMEDSDDWKEWLKQPHTEKE